ncbi:MAG: hypothetical protein Q7K21_00280 [Elusimicrobiota bacterium]|nr:hypothetical protein [Elusimicrobiota bacterium]
MRTKILNSKDILKFVKISLKQRGISPTVRETANYFDISKSAAHLYLKDLYKKKTIKIRKSQDTDRIVARGFILKKS